MTRRAAEKSSVLTAVWGKESVCSLLLKSSTTHTITIMKTLTSRGHLQPAGYTLCDDRLEAVFCLVFMTPFLFIQKKMRCKRGPRLPDHTHTGPWSRTWTAPALQALTCQETRGDGLLSTGLYFASTVSCFLLCEMKQSLSLEFLPLRPPSVRPFRLISRLFVTVPFLVL